MPRSARRISPTNYYHIMMRGNNREDIFAQKEEKRYFLNLLHKVATDQGLGIAAYCVMSNHVHILVEAELPALSNAMRRLNVVFAMYYNNQKQRVGHVFQDRFKSQMITDEVYLLRCMRYIHNNPVKAQIVASPEHYTYSSFQEYLGAVAILDSGQKNRMLHYFDYNIRTLREFHGGQDDDEYLELPEQIEEENLHRGMEIINRYLQKEKFSGMKELTANPNILDQLLKELSQNTKMSRRQMGLILGVSDYYIRKRI